MVDAIWKYVANCNPIKTREKYRTYRLYFFLFQVPKKYPW
jgi:hypothetical protein